MTPLAARRAIRAVSVERVRAGFPNKVVRIVVPYPAGGIADKIAREVAQALGKRWNQSVIVENRTGAAGNVGMDYVAKQPADGYALALVPASNLTVNDVLFKSLTYDIRKDFAPISMLISTPQMLVTHPGVGAKTMKDFIAFAKANPPRPITARRVSAVLAPRRRVARLRVRHQDAARALPGAGAG